MHVGCVGCPVLLLQPAPPKCTEAGCVTGYSPPYNACREERGLSDLPWEPGCWCFHPSSSRFQKHLSDRKRAPGAGSDLPPRRRNVVGASVSPPTTTGGFCCSKGAWPARPRVGNEPQVWVRGSRVLSNPAPVQQVENHELR